MRKYLAKKLLNRIIGGYALGHQDRFLVPGKSWSRPHMLMAGILGVKEREIRDLLYTEKIVKKVSPVMSTAEVKLTGTDTLILWYCMKGIFQRKFILTLPELINHVKKWLHTKPGRLYAILYADLDDEDDLDEEVFDEIVSGPLMLQLKLALKRGFVKYNEKTQKYTSMSKREYKKTKKKKAKKKRKSHPRNSYRRNPYGYRRNADEKLRRYQRLAASGDLEAEAMVLKLRIKSGELTQRQVAMDAFRGDEASLLLYPNAGHHSCVNCNADIDILSEYFRPGQQPNEDPGTGAMCKNCMSLYCLDGRATCYMHLEACTKCGIRSELTGCRICLVECAGCGASHHKECLLSDGRCRQLECRPIPKGFEEWLGPSIDPAHVKLVVTYSEDWESWSVKYYLDDVYSEDKTYYASDKGDAMNSAENMKDEAEEAGYTVSLELNEYEDEHDVWNDYDDEF